MAEKRYMCAKDLQDGDWCVGEVMTAKEWSECAYGWADSDCWTHPEECLLENFNTEQELIDFIQDMWQIKIEEV